MVGFINEKQPRNLTSSSCSLCSSILFYDSDLELASSSNNNNGGDENASIHSGGETTPVMERKAVRFLSRDNSMGVEDKVALLSNVQNMSDDNI